MTRWLFEFERRWREAVTVVGRLRAAAERRAYIMWAAFRRLHPPEQISWAFLAVVAIVCVLMRAHQLLGGR
jgi:hypothetical protein